MCLIETFIRVRVDKNLSDKLPVGNGLKQGDAQSPFLLNFALEYAIRRIQVNQDDLQLNGTHHILVYANNVNVLGGNVYNIKERAVVPLVATIETGQELNADKSKYLILSQNQNAGRKHSIEIDNDYFEMVEEFKYLETTLKTQNCIQEKIKGRLMVENVCCHSVQNILSFSLLSNKFKYQDIQNYNFACCFV